MKDKRLRRSESQKMLFGVCGGLAEYFDVDPTIVRVLFIIAALFQGVGIILYIALAIIMPKNPAGVVPHDQGPSTERTEPPSAQTPPPATEPAPPPAPDEEPQAPSAELPEERQADRLPEDRPPA